MADDYSTTTQTAGAVSVGGTATGEIETRGDRDWFAVELVAGRTYVIDLRGSPTGDGSLRDTYLRGIHDAGGNVIVGTTDDDGGTGLNSRETFTATESGTYYIVAGAYSGVGTYEIAVTDTTPSSGATREEAIDLGDIAGLARPQFPRGTLDDAADAVKWYRFELTEAKKVGLGLREQLANADLVVTDADGNELHAARASGTANEWLSVTLLAGTYHVRVEAQETGSGTYMFRYGVTAPDAAEVTRLEQQEEAPDEAPTFAAASYAFDLSENADGSTDRVALGAVSATDPEEATLTYGIEGGNEAGLFEIDAATGALSYTGVGEDHESGTTIYALTVRASDGSLYSDVSVTVTVADVDEAPAFTAASYAFDLSENADGSTDRVALGAVSATDPEEATLTYSIESGNGAGLFEIDAATGALSYTGVGEDHESGTASYALTVRASDGSLYSDVSVTVTVADVDEAPAFTAASYAFDLAENADGSTGRVALGAVSATDPEEAALTYGIEGGNGAGLFEIDAASGELFYTGVGEDHESGSTQFELTVRASDGSHQTDVTVTVAVTDVEEQAEVEVPDTTPSIGSPRDEAIDLGDITDLARPQFPRGTLDDAADAVKWYRFELTEAKKVGLGLREQLANADLVVTDADGNELHAARASGTANEWLSVTLLAGTYHVRVEAQEAGSGTYMFRYGVTAPDAAEVARLEQQEEAASYAFDLAENADGSTDRVALGAVSATDPEEATLTYSIEGGNGAGLFEIDAATGALSYTGGGEDYESDATGYELTVRASDGSLHTDVAVSVNVTDVAESNPEQGDLPGGITTTGRVVIGDTVTGEVETPGDRDWFAVDLLAGTTYRFELEDGPETRSETRSDPYLRGVYDSEGDLLYDPADDGNNSRADFTATENATHYVEIGAEGEARVTYRLSVREAPDDFAAGTGTDGEVAVGGSATGEIETPGDRDWFAVNLEAGQTYRFDLEGSPTGGGTLRDPYLRGIYTADGDIFFFMENNNGGTGLNSRVEFTPTETATYYVAAGAFQNLTGDYTLSVTDLTDSITDDFAAGIGTSGEVTVGGSATGEIEYAGDRDWFAVTLEAGTTYRIDLEGSSTGAGGLHDPYLYGIHDANGDRLPGTTNNNSGGGLNSRVEFTPTETATYYVAAGDYRSGNTGDYALSVSEVADDFAAGTGTSGAVEVGGSATGRIHYVGDRDWFAVDLQAGTIYRIDLEGTGIGGQALYNPYLDGVHDADGALLPGTTSYSDGAGRNSRVYFTPTANDTYYVSAGSNGSLTGAYTLSVEEVTDDFAAGTDTTGALEVGGSARGGIDYAGDRDWFAVELEGGTTYRIDLEGWWTRRAGDLWDPYLRGVYDADGAFIPGTRGDDGGTGLNSQVFFTPTETATYYVAAGAFQNLTGDYTLSMNEVADDDFAAGTVTDGVVTVGGSVTGDIETPGDRDWFAVDLDAGKTYRIDLEGLYTGDGDLYDPYLRGIYDADGALLPGTSDDDGGHVHNSRVYFTPTADDTYYVSAGSYGRLTGDYTLSVTEIEDDFATGTGTSGEVTVGGSATGEIDYAGDRDWFAVNLEAGTTYRIDLKGSWTGDGTLANSYLRGIRDAAGNRLPGTSDDDGGERYNSRVEFTATEAGTYYVVAGAAHHHLTGTYTLSVEEGM